jgi:hypothetical protein
MRASQPASTAASASAALPRAGVANPIHDTEACASRGRLCSRCSAQSCATAPPRECPHKTRRLPRARASRYSASTGMPRARATNPRCAAGAAAAVAPPPPSDSLPLPPPEESSAASRRTSCKGRRGV